MQRATCEGLPASLSVLQASTNILGASPKQGLRSRALKASKAKKAANKMPTAFNPGTLTHEPHSKTSPARLEPDQQGRPIRLAPRDRHAVSPERQDAKATSPRGTDEGRVPSLCS